MAGRRVARDNASTITRDTRFADDGRTDLAIADRLFAIHVAGLRHGARLARRDSRLIVTYEDDVQPI